MFNKFPCKSRFLSICIFSIPLPLLPLPPPPPLPTILALLSSAPPLLQDLGSVSLPGGLPGRTSASWLSLAECQQVATIAQLLNQLPCESSAVITSGKTLLTELFSHKGQAGPGPPLPPSLPPFLPPSLRGYTKRRKVALRTRCGLSRVVLRCKQ